MAAVVDVDAFEDKVEGGEEEDELTNSSPQANSDRDYTYEEVDVQWSLGYLSMYTCIVS